MFYGAGETVWPQPVLRGDDLMRELGLEPGPLIGRLLEEVRGAQAAGEVQTREEALEWARQALLVARQGLLVGQQEDEQGAQAQEQQNQSDHHILRKGRVKSKRSLDDL